MKNIRKKRIRQSVTVIVILLIMFSTMPVTEPYREGDVAAAEKAVEITHGEAGVLRELTEKRTKFTKQYIMSDGSFLADSYSMPVHYKKNGKWQEADTTLVKKKNKKVYTTKSTSLGIRVTGKANGKAEVTLKRGKSRLSMALKGKKIRKKAVSVQNPRKKDQTDILNCNQVQYKKAYKNQTLSYEIYPEKVVEKIKVKKKSSAKELVLRLDGGKQKVKVKNDRIYFQNKKGKTKYTRLKTIVTDAAGVSTSKVKVTYDKKKKTLTLKPNKKWLKSKKRKFSLTFRTAYITDLHERDVKIGAAYAGAPDANYTYDESLLLQAGKAIVYTQMGNLAELGKPDVKVRNARLYIENETSLNMGTGKTFQIGIHKVNDAWNGKKVTYHKRPSYEQQSSAEISIKGKGRYTCDVTGLVKAWYEGDPNNGVVLAADNSNGSYQAKIQKNPHFSIHYEIVGFGGALELKENQDVTIDVLKSGQENYFYFDARPDIAYDLYTTSTLDTQGILYDKDKNRLAYDDNSGLNDNFQFIKNYDGRRYLKVNVKGNTAGQYTLSLKKRFAVPEPTGIKGEDKYTVTWDSVKNAKEYLVCIYDAGKKIDEAVVTGTEYEFVYNSTTRGKILGFTVTARENATLAGEVSRMIFNTDNLSEWVYESPMPERRKNAAAVEQNGKLYVLGGQDDSGAMKSFAAYDTEKEVWEKLPDYPGTESGICRTSMVALKNEIYVIGGQTDMGTNAKLLTSVYAYNAEAKRWQKKTGMSEGRTDLAVVLCGDKIYAFPKAGKTKQAMVYDTKKDTWETRTLPDTSTVIAAAAVDNRIFVLREDGENMYWSEYLPEEEVFENEGTVCPAAVSDTYVVPAVISGKIYMVKEKETKEVLVYDAYTDEWSRISSMNLAKKNSLLLACRNDVYSVGGEMEGFGTLDVVERYSIKVQTIKKQMLINRDEAYELQVAAGNLKKGQTKLITLSVNPDELEIQNASSFAEEEALKKGADGVTLVRYQPKKGVMVLKLTGKLEQGQTYETCQSVPVKAKSGGKTTVEIAMEEREDS